MELPKGGRAFVNIKLPALNGLTDADGAIRWDGKYLAFTNAGHTIYRLVISGGKARIAGRVEVSNVKNTDNIWIQNNTIVGSTDVDGVLIWNYPAGGKPIRIIPRGGSRSGVAVSIPAST